MWWYYGLFLKPNVLHKHTEVLKSELIWYLEFNLKYIKYIKIIRKKRDRWTKNVSKFWILRWIDPFIQKKFCAKSQLFIMATYTTAQLEMWKAGLEVPCKCISGLCVKLWWQEKRIKGHIFRWYIYQLSQILGHYDYTSNAHREKYLFTVKLQTTENGRGGCSPWPPTNGTILPCRSCPPWFLTLSILLMLWWLPCGE